MPRGDQVTIVSMAALAGLIQTSRIGERQRTNSKLNKSKCANKSRRVTSKTLLQPR
jgi:hypothetical protein